MFDIGWSELVVVGIVALLVVGPKELPALLRTIGRYIGIVKRQANEFRAQFDEAMRETEIDQLRKEVAALKTEAETSLRSAEQSVESELAEARSELDSVAAAAAPAVEQQPQPALAVSGDPAAEPPASVNGAGANGYDGAVARPDEAEGDRAVKSGT
ncbi:MAG: Sec-independent protein translocase protein TatB [Hyphomicrobiaceae bacterium]|nr:Sec-independent protein translocase protein TatB [Hyphomicrobiaceae bacterium]